MSDILLDYAFKVSTVTPIPSASVAYLKDVLVIAKPKSVDVPQEIVEVFGYTEVQALTDNSDSEQLFNAGMLRAFILPSNNLNIAEIINSNVGKFFTILISSDFTDEEAKSRNFGIFDGVVGYTSYDRAKAKEFAVTQCGFYGAVKNNAKNMFNAFGKFLSSTKWRNQQYIDMPVSDTINTLGLANGLFEDRVSFVITSTESGNKLGFFAVGKQAIIAPYITTELKVKLQSKFVQYVALNNPKYTVQEAALIETALQDVIDGYVNRGDIEFGKITIALENENFVASGNITISEPNALWKTNAELIQGVL